MFSTGHISPRVSLGNHQADHYALIEKINTKIAKGQAASALHERSHAYQEAFAAMRLNAQETGSLPIELQPSLFNLLHRIASDLYYNKDGAIGFCKSAYLMQLSLLMQMNFLGLGEYSYPWHDADSFQDLIAKLEADDMNQFAEMSTYEQQIYPSQLEKTLKQFTPESQKLLSDTLTRLIYSYQNMSQYNAINCENKRIQNNWQALTEAAIGNETPEQRGAFADLAYNRWPFLEQFNHEDPNSKECKHARVACYESIRELFEAAYGSASPVYLAKASQIQNMRGLFTLRIDGSLITEARGYFENAYDLRLQIGEPAEGEAKWEYDFLLNNIRTGLIHVLINSGNVSKDDCKKILFHSQAIGEFFSKNMAEGRKTAHDESYMQAVQSAQAFFQNPEHMALLTSP